MRVGVRVGVGGMSVAVLVRVGASGVKVCVVRMAGAVFVAFALAEGFVAVGVFVANESVMTSVDAGIGVCVVFAAT